MSIKGYDRLIELATKVKQYDVALADELKGAIIEFDDAWRSYCKIVADNIQIEMREG